MIQTRWLVLSMVTAVVAIGALAYWDERRRSEAGLDDLGDEQASVAEAAGLAVAGALETADRDPAARARAIAALQRLERDGVRVLLAAPGAAAQTLDDRPDDRPDGRPDGHRVELPRLADGIARGVRALRLSREDARELGLPARTAVVGLTRLASGWTVAVAATAERQRDRDRAGLLRLLLSLGVATGLVTVFGGLALARQRSGGRLEALRAETAPPAGSTC